MIECKERFNQARRSRYGQSHTTFQDNNVVILYIYRTNDMQVT